LLKFLVVGSTLIFTATKFLNLHATLVNDADPVPDTDPIFHFDPTPSYSQVRNIFFKLLFTALPIYMVLSFLISVIGLMDSILKFS
jgi:hypothetical protein